MPGGWTTTFTYSGGELSSIQEPGGRVVTVTHDSSDDLTSATMPDGSVNTFTYDSAGQMLNRLAGHPIDHLHVRLGGRARDRQRRTRADDEPGSLVS